jgi:hypothetical protein
LFEFFPIDFEDCGEAPDGGPLGMPTFLQSVAIPELLFI